MVCLLSQMEGNDHSMDTSEHSTPVQIDNSGVVGNNEGLMVKEEKPTAEMCQETEPCKDGSDAVIKKIDDSTSVDNSNEEEVHTKELKSILKRRGQYTMRKVKVDFDLIPKRIPFDETKDYTVEIQIVDKEPVKIKSWAAIFAAKKAEAEAEEAAAAEAEAALKKAEEVQKREALKRANKAKQVKKEGCDKSDKDERHRSEEKVRTTDSVTDQQPAQLDEDHQIAKQVECSSHEICEVTGEVRTSELSSNEPAQLNANIEEITGQSEGTDDTPENSNIEEAIVQLDQATDEEVSVHFSENVKGAEGEQVRSILLEEDIIESEEKAGLPTDESKSVDGIGSVKIELFEKQQLPVEIMVTAVSLVEDILAETPVKLRAISSDDENETESASVDKSDLGKDNLQDRDKTESIIEELSNEDITESKIEELTNEDKTESNVDEFPNEDKSASNIDPFPNEDITEWNAEELLNSDMTESINEESLSENKMESINEEFQDADKSDTATGEIRKSGKMNDGCAEEVQLDTACTPEVKEYELGNAKTFPTDEHRAKANHLVVSQKLHESLKKASPEIIQTAVRVLVDIEKVTLAVVKNLEPIVP